MDKLSECPVCKNTHLLFLNNCFRCGAHLGTHSISTKVGYHTIINVFEKYPLSVISLSLVLLSLLWNPLQDFVDIFLFYILFVNVDILSYFIKWKLKNVALPIPLFSTPLWLRMVFALAPLQFILYEYSGYVKETIWIEKLESIQTGQAVQHAVPYLIKLFSSQTFLIVTSFFLIFVSYFAFIRWLNIKIFISPTSDEQYPRVFYVTSLREKYNNIKRWSSKNQFLLNWYLSLGNIFFPPIVIFLIAGMIMGFTTYFIKTLIVTLGGTFGGFLIDFGLSFLIAFIEVKNSWEDRKKENSDEGDETVLGFAEIVSKKEEKGYDKFAKMTLYYLGKITIFGILIIWFAVFNWENLSLFTYWQFIFIAILTLPILIFTFNYNYCLDSTYKNNGIIKNADIFLFFSLFFIFFIYMNGLPTGIATIKIGKTNLLSITILIGFIFSILMVINYILYNKRNKFSSYNIRFIGTEINPKRLVWFSSLILIILNSLDKPELAILELMLFISIFLFILFLKLIQNQTTAFTEVTDSKILNKSVLDYNKKFLLVCMILQLAFVYSIIDKMIDPWISYISLILLTLCQIFLIYDMRRLKKMDKLSECPVCKNRHLLFLRNCFRCGAQLGTHSISTKVGYHTIINVFEKYPLSVISLSLVLLSLLWNPLQDFVDLFLFYILFINVDILSFFIKGFNSKKITIYENASTTPYYTLSTPLSLKMVLALAPMIPILLNYANYIEQVIWTEYLEQMRLGQTAQYNVPYIVNLFWDINFEIISLIIILILSYIMFVRWLDTKIFLNSEQNYSRLLDFTSLKDRYTNITKFTENQKDFFFAWYGFLALMFLAGVVALVIAGAIFGFVTYFVKNMIAVESGGFYIDFGMSVLIATIEVKKSWEERKKEKTETDDNEKTITKIADFVFDEKQKKILPEERPFENSLINILLYYVGKITSFIYLIPMLALFLGALIKYNLLTLSQILLIVFLGLPMVIFVFHFNYCLDRIYKKDEKKFLVKNSEIFYIVSVFFLLWFILGIKFDAIDIWGIRFAYIEGSVAFIFSIFILANYIYMKKHKVSSSYSTKFLGKEIKLEGAVWYSNTLFILLSFIQGSGIIGIGSIAGLITTIIIGALVFRLMVKNIFTIIDAKDSITRNIAWSNMFKFCLIVGVIMQLGLLYIMFVERYIISFSLGIIILIILTLLEIYFMINIKNKE